VPGWQVLSAAQQPFGQVVAVHTHCRLLASQVVPLGQIAHRAPPVPQAWLVFPARQNPGLPGPFGQQPSGRPTWAQKVASHWQCPLTQRPSRAKIHSAHSAPPVPQANCSVPGWQTKELSQQPAHRSVQSTL
jgi:hypothetical protein